MEAPEEEPEMPGPVREIAAGVTGYIQFVDGDRLLKIAAQRDLLIEVQSGPGVFARPFDCLARIGGAAELNEKTCRRIRGAFAIDRHRTAAQDIDFLFRQLTEIAVRALSPGTNDPFTAAQCVDRLTAALSDLAGRKLPPALRRDENGGARVIARPVRFPQVAQASLSSIRRYGASHEEVISTLLKGIEEIAPCARGEDDRRILLEEARLALAAVSRWDDEPARGRIEGRFGFFRSGLPAANALTETPSS